jgi:hypothetical protein
MVNLGSFAIWTHLMKRYTGEDHLFYCFLDVYYFSFYFQL